jgi:hypothetical protein
MGFAPRQKHRRLMEKRYIFTVDELNRRAHVALQDVPAEQPQSMII